MGHGHTRLLGDGWQGLRLTSAGIVCLDLTQFGEQFGLAGPHTRVFLLWVAERRAVREPVWVAECVVSEVLQKALVSLLGDIYDVEVLPDQRADASVAASAGLPSLVNFVTDQSAQSCFWGWVYFGGSTRVCTWFDRW